MALKCGVMAAEPWTKPGAEGCWQNSLDGFPTAGALPAVKNKVGDLHLNFRQLDVLMGVIGLGFRKIGVSARAALGFEGLDLAGFQQLLPMPLVAFFATGFFALWLVFGFFLVGGVAGWRLIGV